MAERHLLTVEQLQDILKHDGPTDIWLVEDTGDITVVPDQSIAPFMRVGHWPRYLARSLTIDKIVLQHINDPNPQRGYLTALTFINREITRMTPDNTAAARMGEALGKLVTQLFTAGQ
ncbi:hypothetical protein GCM10007304_17490 [Rhodococcoides trifolii]|uniref:Uncharacterized protein n=1 Tax=Rhodococcoides trifolii TaxID=908250 RepID=A0A917D0G8_9NOCA|nr:hypothetical protein [Rhodococcus trifolii]GGG03857.1 hypothetical protein GCM10007304_17490 [Rhodococcus trifolii]